MTTNTAALVRKMRDALASTESPVDIGLKRRKAIAAADKWLAQQPAQAEPSGEPAYYVSVSGRLHETEPTALAFGLPDGRHPLYAANAVPIAQPLTDGQIVGIAIGAGVDPDDEDDDGTTVFAIARAVEAACAKAWGVKLEGVRCNAGLGLVQKREQLGE